MRHDNPTLVEVTACRLVTQCYSHSDWIDGVLLVHACPLLPSLPALDVPLLYENDTGASPPALSMVADALVGRSRAESAWAAGISTTEVSRRRREAMRILTDRIYDLLNHDAEVAR